MQEEQTTRWDPQLPRSQAQGQRCPERHLETRQRPRPLPEEENPKEPLSSRAPGALAAWARRSPPSACRGAPAPALVPACWAASVEVSSAKRTGVCPGPSVPVAA